MNVASGAQGIPIALGLAILFYAWLAWASRSRYLFKTAEFAVCSVFNGSKLRASSFLKTALGKERSAPTIVTIDLKIQSDIMPPKRKTAAAAEKAEGETKTKQAKQTGTKKEKAKPKKAASVREPIPDVSGMDFKSDSKTPDGKPWNIKFSSWNINGVRAWQEKNGHSYILKEDPDIFCVQETKCNTENIPKEVEVTGYHVYWYPADKEGYSGTGLFSKKEPIKVSYGIGAEKHDTEGRVITAEYDNFYFVTAYIPNAGRGLPRLPYREKEWDPDFRAYLQDLDKKKSVILCGDLNVAHKEIDLANPKTNKKTAGFTPQERDGFTALLEAGFVDSFRQLYPDLTGAYSYWTYMGNARSKNVGWRLDYFVISDRLKSSLCDSVIRKDVMGSDHCPITLFMRM